MHEGGCCFIGFLIVVWYFFFPFVRVLIGVGEEVFVVAVISSSRRGVEVIRHGLFGFGWFVGG